MPAITLNKSTERLGFIGLGLMGSRLTRRLHSFGWNVRAWNRSPEPANAMRREGIEIAASIRELAGDSEVILSSLTNDAAVRSVYFEKDGVFPWQSRGPLFLR